MKIWQTKRFAIDLAVPRIMGIVNVTPDSFSDGGEHADVAGAMAHCDRLLREGAHILDIGGESTRPGARTPTMEEELQRVLPVLRQAVKLGVPVSVDTSRPEVMRVALEIGVDIVNDVRALQREGAIAVLAGDGRAGICLMHMLGEPDTMQSTAPRYDDVVADVRGFLADRLAALRAADITLDRVVVDPGIGFGKTGEHNMTLLRRQRELLDLGAPLLVGWSRKSTLGTLTGREARDRQVASAAAALLAVQRGASVVRVHDVAATVDALAIWRSVEPNNQGIQ
jgi:dihydropteroate synthase